MEERALEILFKEKEKRKKKKEREKERKEINIGSQSETISVRHLTLRSLCSRA